MSNKTRIININGTDYDLTPVAEVIEIINADGWHGFRMSDGTVDMWNYTVANSYSSEYILQRVLNFPSGVSLSDCAMMVTLNEAHGGNANYINEEARIEPIMTSSAFSGVTVYVTNPSGVFTSSSSERISVHVVGLSA